MSSVDSLAARLLSATLMFDQASLAALEALAAESDRRLLRRGEVLVREGDPSDRFFIVLSGRFTVHKGGSAGPVAEIGQGELVGEVGFFAGLPRMATVFAARDSIVLEIRGDHFEKAAEFLPSLRQAVTVFLARRFAMQSASSSRLKEARQDPNACHRSSRRKSHFTGFYPAPAASVRRGHARAVCRPCRHLRAFCRPSGR